MKDLSIEELKEKRAICIQRLKNADFNLLRGSLIELYKRCGKLGCKCAKDRGHGPKHYLSVSFPGHRPHMVYVPSNIKSNIEICLENLRVVRHLIEEITQLNLELLKRKEVF